VFGGAQVRVASEAGDGFDDVYDLPPVRWNYVGKPGANKGYKFRDTAVVRSAVHRPGRFTLKAKGGGLGHTLTADPRPVTIGIRIGARRYCAVFGGTVTFKPEKKLVGKNAPAAATCPPGF
jgi:hypothetical protein